MIKRIVFILLLQVFLLGTKSYAQDPHFSQFYAAPTFMSPSLAGSTGGVRLVSNYRNQWPGIKQAYHSYAVSADMYVNKYRSGFGAIMVTDQAGSADYNTTYLGLQYSYRIQLGENLQFIPGLQFTLGQMSLNRNKLIFPDGLVNGGQSSGDAYLAATKANYLDFNTSLFLYSRKYWIGTTVEHMMQPSYSFLDDQARTPMKMVVFGGMNVWRERVSRIEEPRRAAFCYRYERQHNFNQLDFGAYWYSRSLEFGAWWRGIPVFKNENLGTHYLDNDAIVLSAALVTGSFRFGYSYDIQTSDLAGFGGGAHEISIIIEFGDIFGCGAKYLDCFTKRAGLHFNKEQPRNLKIYY
ncbi:PorP/SprF family type IX secretion system membrane protein [Prolixibacter denitrificans]|uniref:Type IX secretion system PorP/SprF family membrane protein n=2 Tax=Prolixibacter TaxID=314318 RepID=A0A2P8CKW7_9BACT|nr:PorP/SprF family type IX secretion system membrane protein [Prolixibacter denitrificans]PSK85602.1 type IX secretion system PorP/SprF family membrane protein [Prolixibacter denitrificans]GET20222.1 hypothetical protein JCM18694_04680 [Prolixibacter denitrificans]GET26902.1 hypothetical protein NT017_32310 [Prolixibacter sp. NT017]